jgi:hypothetical protein
MTGGTTESTWQPPTQGADADDAFIAAAVGMRRLLRRYEPVAAAVIAGVVLLRLGGGLAGAPADFSGASSTGIGQPPVSAPATAAGTTTVPPAIESPAGADAFDVEIPAAPTPAGFDAAVLESPAPSDPPPSDPAPSEPAPSEPAPSEPAPSEPAPTLPVPLPVEPPLP